MKGVFLGYSRRTGSSSASYRRLTDLGELAEARDLLRLALASDQQTFPAGHLNIAIVQQNLAIVLWNIGEWDEARRLAQPAYTATLATFGPDHATTAL